MLVLQLQYKKLSDNQEPQGALAGILNAKVNL